MTGNSEYETVAGRRVLSPFTIAWRDAVIAGIAIAFGLALIIVGEVFQSLNLLTKLGAAVTGGAFGAISATFWSARIASDRIGDAEGRRGVGGANSDCYAAAGVSKLKHGYYNG